MWKVVEVGGSRWNSMKVGGSRYESSWESMEADVIDGNQWNSVEVNVHWSRWKVEVGMEVNGKSFH